MRLGCSDVLVEIVIYYGCEETRHCFAYEKRMKDLLGFLTTPNIGDC